MDNVDRIESAMRGVELDIKINDLQERLSGSVSERVREQVARYMVSQVNRDPMMQRRVNEANQKGGQDEAFAELGQIIRERTTIGAKDFDMNLFNILHSEDDEIVLKPEWAYLEKEIVISE